MKTIRLLPRTRVVLALCGATASLLNHAVCDASWKETLVAWGDNAYNQVKVPSGLPANAHITGIAAGNRGSVVLRADGNAFAWGENFSGLDVTGFGFKAVAAGGYHYLALLSDGTVYGWGDTSAGQLNYPAGLSGVIAIAAGYYHSLALKSDGTVVAWGYNGFGQCNVPAGLSGIVAIAAGFNHSLALTSDGRIAAWGDNTFGQTSVPDYSDYIAISAGYFHNVALRSGGTVVAWGSNAQGQLNVPGGLNGVIAVAAGYFHNLALKGDGTITAWGDNTSGQCNVPSGLSNVLAIAAGGYHSLVIAAPPSLLAFFVAPNFKIEGGSSKGSFTWNGGLGASSYALWVGSTLDSYDLYAGNEGLNLARVLNLPADGRMLYVTLWSWVNGAWQPNRYTFFAPTATLAAMTTPGDGTTLPGRTVTFTWTASDLATSYALWVGNTPNSCDLYAGIERGLSRTLTLPTDGRTIYVTLWTWMNGSWQANTYTYTAYTAPIAELITPAPGSLLTGDRVDFEWAGVKDASSMALWLGSTPGGHDLYASLVTGQSRVLPVPMGGGPLYVTLWTYIHGLWRSNTCTYTTYPGAGPEMAPIESPAPGSTLNGDRANFQWNSGVGATQYALWVGTTANSYNLYAAYETGLSRIVRLPTNGETIHATLWSCIGGTWQANLFMFTAFIGAGPQRAQMLLPAPDSTLAGAATKFSWSSGVGPTQYALWVGSSPNAYDLYAGLENGLWRALVLPTDGRTLYVRLWSQINGVWQWNDYQYTAFGAHQW